MGRRWAAAACWLGLWTAAAAASAPNHDYCIVGAGPGGIQLGQFMLAAERDYTIFERAATAGSFFQRFPIHRKLISLNKRNTGRDNPEFNLRHDWNSLLGNDECLPVTNRTTDRFPSADILVEYLQDFAKPQEAAGRIEYGADVQHISRADDGVGFSLEIRDANLHADRSAHCNVLIMAHGLWTVNRPTLEGADLMTGYEELPPTGDFMEAKSVAIFGLGNSAFEVANAAADYANYVHVWPTRDKVWDWPHNSWESRYVGSLRAIRTGHLDGYLLKSLDGLPLGNSIVATKDRLMIKPCFDTQLCMFLLIPERPDVFVLSFHNTLDSEQAAALETLKKTTGIRIEESPLPPGISQTMIDVLEGNGQRTREYPLRMPGIALLVPREDCNNETVAAIMKWRKRTGDTLSRPYDMVVRAMGWRHNTTLYEPSVKPKLQSQRKYPQMTPEYESENVPGMFFCGTLAHGKDWKRAAGGFIHGFRYTARALFHILEAKYEARPAALWNQQEYSVPKDNQKIAQRIMRRINEASGPYQMFYTLGDGMVLNPPKDGGSWTLTYFEEIPIDYLNWKYAGQHRLMWLFGFDGQRRTLTESIAKGTGFEPSVWYWPPETTTTEGLDTEIFRMIEHLHTDWSGDFFDFSLRRWFSAKIEAIMLGQGSSGHNLMQGKESNGRGHFDDHLGFDAFNGRRTSEFAVVEVDFTVVNRLKKKGSTLSLYKATDMGTPIAQLSSKEFHRMVSYDGEAFVAEGRGANGKLITREEWTVRFSRGIVQERHVEGPQPAATPPSGAGAGKVADASPGGSGSGSDYPPLPPLAELEELKARDLKELLTERGLNTKGKKAALLSRLDALPRKKSPLQKFMGGAKAEL